MNKLDEMQHSEVEKWINENYADTEEAGVLLSIKTKSVSEYLRTGRVEGIKLGKGWMVSRASIQQWNSQEKNKGGRPKKSG